MLRAAQTVIKSECHDFHGVTVKHGSHYVPGPENCKLCICENGQPIGCKAVLCSPPQGCTSFKIGNSCCEFICMDETLAGNANGDRTTDFGI